MNIQEYCDTLNIEIKLTYYPNQNGRWCEQFDRCEFKYSAMSACLSSTHGNGISPQAAIDDFLKRIRGKLLVIDAMNETRRREYIVPVTLRA